MAAQPARVGQIGASPVVPMHPMDLASALQRAGITLLMVAPNALRARPATAITEPIATAITHHKPALLDFLRALRGGPATPFICPFCTARFVRAADEWCPDCADLRGRPMEFEPGSLEEAAFVARLETRRDAQRVSANCVQPCPAPIAGTG